MRMRVFDKIYFQDSLCHIAASLAQFPAIFGLDETVYKKGFFPYLFNTPENQNYIGRMPAMSYFEPNLMAPAKRKEFLTWYIDNANVPYDFRKELEEYCRSDVRILANAMEVYVREGMTQNSGLNPMEEITIASYALRIYKTLYMPEEVVAYIPPAAQQFARRAFSGGRTDVRKMLRFWTKDEIAAGKYGVYQDVQSLYPTVQWYDPMPVGHPTTHVYIDEAGNTVADPPTQGALRSFFGFIECDMTPMCYMHHPVIVEKKDGKLMADLYPKERIVITSVEFQEALKQGYSVGKIYQIQEYAKSTDLFTDYISTFLKLKVEAGGMPKWIKNDRDWKEFEEKHAELGIKLDKADMVKNNGRKQLAKLMLNSLWGKFAQRPSIVYVIYFLLTSRLCPKQNMSLPGRLS